MAFESNVALLEQYAAQFDNDRRGRGTFVDFGKVPQDPFAQQDWQAKGLRFIAMLRARGYLLTPTIRNAYTGLCPLYEIQVGDISPAL